MANVKNNTKETIEENSIQHDNSAIMKMLESFQEQLEILKIKNDELESENKTLKDKTLVNNIDDEENFDPNKLITIRNMYSGLELNLKVKDNGETKRMTKYGGAMKVRIIEALEMVRLNDTFAKKGYFVIEDRKLLDTVFSDLKEHYEKVVDHKVLNQIQNLELNTLKDIFMNANLSYQKLIVDKFITEYTKGEIIEFRNQNKINLLSELTGENIMEMINNVGLDENLRNEYMKK